MSTEDPWSASPALWRPIFARMPRLADVSSDARALNEQQAHFSQLIAHIPATFDESDGIAQAFQLCEHTHGYPPIAEALPRVTRLCVDALLLTRMTLSTLAAQRGYASAGLWVGALVERYAGVAADRWRFPALDAAPRWASARIEFEDIEQALDIALALGEVSLRNLRAGALQPHAALTMAFRVARGESGWQTLQRLARGCDDLSRYARLVRAEADAHGLQLPVDWLWLEAVLRQSARPNRLRAARVSP
jgi:hypothetical protein